MAVSLSQIRIEATMDASAYTAGASQKAAADQKMVASGDAVAKSLTQTEQRLGSQSSALERLTRSIDPAYAAQQKYAQGQTVLQRALDAGKISADEYQQRLEQVRQRYLDLPRPANDAAVSTASLRFAVRDLGFQLNDVATQLLSGTSPFRVLVQQGGQIQGAFSMGGGAGAVMRAFADEMKALVTPTTLAIAGVTALAGAAFLLFERYEQNRATAREFNLALGQTGTYADASVKSMQAGALALRNMGVAAADANKLMFELARNPIINPNQIGSLTNLGANLAPRLGIGVTPDEGVKALTTALNGGVESMVRFGVELHAIDSAEAANILIMAQHGDRAGALNKAIEDLRVKFGDTRSELGEGTKAAESLTAAWNKLMNGLTDSGGFEVAHNGLVRLLNDLTNIIEKGQLPNNSALPSLLMLIPGYGALGAVLSAANAAQSNPLLQGLGSGAGAIKAGSLPNTGPMAGIYGPVRPNYSGSLAAGGGLQNPLPSSPIDAALAIIMQNESGGRNIEQQLVPRNVSSASGYFQMLDSTWRAGAGLAGIDTSLYPRAIDAPFEMQRSAAAALLAQPGGINNWANPQWGVKNWNSLRAAGFQVGPGAPGIGSGAANENTIVTSPEVIAKAKAALDEYNITAEQQLKIAAETGPKQQALTAYYAQYNSTLKETGDKFLAMDAGNAAYNATLQHTSVEVAKQNTLFQQATEGQNKIAEAYAQSAKAGLEATAAEEARIQVMERGGNVTQVTAQIIERYRSAERIANAQAIQQEKDRQQLLQLEISLQGQLPEEITRQLTLLQSKLQIDRETALLGPEQVENRRREAAATADLAAKLVEANREQQKIDDTFRSIGDTIDQSITQAITDAFDPTKVTDWGKSIRTILGQITSEILNIAVIKPAIGSVLSALGASPNVVQQFGSFGGGLGSLFGGSSSSASSSPSASFLQAAGLVKDAGGLFSGNGFLGSLFSGGSSATLGAATGGLSALATPTAGLFAGADALGAQAAGAGIAAAQGGLFSTIGSLAGPIGAAVGIGSLLFDGLFGGKPSVGPNSNVDLSTANGLLTLGAARADNGGSAGNAQSMGQAVATAVNAFLKSLGGSLYGIPGGTLIGQDKQGTFISTGSGYSPDQFQHFGDAASAQNALALWLVRNSSNSLTGTVRQVIDAGQATDLNGLASDAAFAKTYDALDQMFKLGDQQAGPFAQKLADLKTQFQDITDKATQFGLSLDPVNEALARGTEQLKNQFLSGLDSAYFQAAGLGAVNQLVALAQSRDQAISDAQALGVDAGSKIQRVIQAQEAAILASLSPDQISAVADAFAGINAAMAGISDTSKATVAALIQQSQANAQVAATATQAAQSLQAYLNGEALGGLSTLSPSDKLAEAQRQFSVALGGSDVSAATSAADALLQAGRAYYATSPGYAALESMTRSQLTGLGHRLGLPGFATGGSFTVGGSGGTDSQLVAFRATPGERVNVGNGAQEALLSQLVALTAGQAAEIAGLRRDIAQLRLQMKFAA